VEVDIERLVWGGAGLGRHGGKVVLVPMTCPGERVLVGILDDRRSFAWGEVIRVVRESGGRTDPACPIFGVCGGCQWQHLAYDTQVEAKGEILHDALRRIGRINAPGPVGVVPSPRQYRYRHRTRIHLAPPGGARVFGFYRRGTREVVPADSCPVLHESLDGMLPILAEHLRSGPALREVTSLLLSADFSGTTVRVSPHGRRGAIHFPPRTAAALETAASPRGVELDFPGRPSLPLFLGSGPLALSVIGDAFTQSNLLQNEALVREVSTLLAPEPGQEVLDLYCGVGNFSIPAAAAGAFVLGIDMSPRAVRSAVSNAARLGLESASFRQGLAEEEAASLARRGRRFDAVLLNPPRTGCRRTVGILHSLGPARVVLVSCDPATFARDAALLTSSGYGLSALRAFDLFPQTFHFETVGLFVR